MRILARLFRGAVLMGVVVGIVSGAASPAPAAPDADGRLPAKADARFPQLGLAERTALIKELRQQDLPVIFQRWRDAKRVDQDPMKQGAFATAFSSVLREKQASPDFVEEMWRFTVDPANSLAERSAIIGIFGFARTKQGIEFILRAATFLEDKSLREIARREIMAAGSLLGDGSYHEERSPPLEQAWRESRDPELLAAVAPAMAKIGAPSAIELLLSAALGKGGRDDSRQWQARAALSQVYMRNALPPVAALLATQSRPTEESKLAGAILVAIGDRAAAEVLLTWLRSADGTVAILVPDFIAESRTPAFLAAWKASLGPETTFRNEQVREAVRTALAKYHAN